MKVRVKNKKVVGTFQMIGTISKLRLYYYQIDSKMRNNVLRNYTFWHYLSQYNFIKTAIYIYIYHSVAF